MWEQIEVPVEGIPVMSCHWSDLDQGLVVPKYDGQVFYLADRNETWVYREEPGAEQKFGKIEWVLTVVFLVLLGIDLALAWLLFHRMGYL